MSGYQGRATRNQNVERAEAHELIEARRMISQSLSGPGSVSASTQTREEQKVLDEVRELMSQNRELSIRLEQALTMLALCTDALAGRADPIEVSQLSAAIKDLIIVVGSKFL
jgi:hypothetical protein